MPITILKPAYEITVGRAYFADRTVSEGTVSFATPIGVETIKSIGVAKQKAEQKLHGSGMVYMLASKKTGAQYTVGAIALPPDLLRKYSGKIASPNKGFAYETANDVSPEFAFGYVTEYSDGKKRFVWAPRCQMTSADNTLETSSDQPVDPNKSYVIVAMPESGYIEVEYDQSLVITGKKPLTEEEFFAAVIASNESAVIDSEVAAV